MHQCRRSSADVAGKIGAVADELADEPEVGQGRALAGSAKRDQRAQAAGGLAVRRCQRDRPGRR